MHTDKSSARRSHWHACSKEKPDDVWGFFPPQLQNQCAVKLSYACMQRDTPGRMAVMMERMTGRLMMKLMTGMRSSWSTLMRPCVRPPAYSPFTEWLVQPENPEQKPQRPHTS